MDVTFFYMSLNKVLLIGRLGGLPTAYKGAKGNFVSFSLATSESWKNKDDTWSQKTHWHKGVVFNERLADRIMQKCDKGAMLFVEGKLQYRDVTTKHTNQTSKTAEIIIDNFNGKVIIMSSNEDVREPKSISELSLSKDWDLNEEDILKNIDLNDDVPF